MLSTLSYNYFIFIYDGDVKCDILIDCCFMDWWPRAGTHFAPEPTDAKLTLPECTA